MLGFVVARRLYLQHPDKPEGQLTNMRGALVRLSRLSAWGAELDLGRYLYLSKGEEAQGGRERPTIIGRAMEALLGALSGWRPGGRGGGARPLPGRDDREPGRGGAHRRLQKPVAARRAGPL